MKSQKEQKKVMKNHTSLDRLKGILVKYKDFSSSVFIAKLSLRGIFALLCCFHSKLQ
jgi:hypothetical protein